MESHEHLALLCIAHTLHGPDQASALRHEKLLMVVRVVVSRQHDQDRAGQTAVDMVGDDTLKHRSLEHSIETALVSVEVVPGHRITFSVGFPLLYRRSAAGHLGSRPLGSCYHGDLWNPVLGCCPTAWIPEINGHGAPTHATRLRFFPSK